MKQLPKQRYQPSDSYIRVATACPEVAVGDVVENTNRIAKLYETAISQCVSLVVFPELSLTGYTLGDLLPHSTIRKQTEESLDKLARSTKGASTAMIVGLPFAMHDQLYNCAALLAEGKIKGIVPKSNLPNYKEFYEKRWFQTWNEPNATVKFKGVDVPFGTDLLFRLGEALIGIEICEDLWVIEQPSQKLAQAGALIIANPSASPEQIAKSGYRRELVIQQSSRLHAGYIYAGCDASESTTDIVMSGHQIIAENGLLLAERPALAMDSRLTVADIDLDHLRYDRLRDTSNIRHYDISVIDCTIVPVQANLIRMVEPLPFVPAGDNSVLDRIFTIQAQALASRIKNSGIKKIVLGLSGGLDSTLALLVAVHAAERLGVLPESLLHTLTMPGAASSRHTQDNAMRLASSLSLPNESIAIADLCKKELAALGHDGTTQDVTYENIQARMRTSLLFNRANQLHGLVLGTGDLSEIALGWSTFNGDHMSHYNVNASIPKTLVKHLVTYAASLPLFAAASPILHSIIATPISPELTINAPGELSQETEKLVGPYTLHDFFLYHFVRWGERPEKIAFLAELAHGKVFTREEIHRWLTIFLERFIENQWKRSVAADGPKVGSVSLSPRGDWRAPSDMTSAAWRDALQ